MYIVTSLKKANRWGFFTNWKKRNNKLCWKQKQKFIDIDIVNLRLELGSF